MMNFFFKSLIWMFLLWCSLNNVSAEDGISSEKMKISMKKKVAEVGYGVDFDVDQEYGEITKCIVQNNNNIYEIYPNLNSTNIDYVDRCNCSFSVKKIQWENSGIWQITSYINVTNKNHTDQEFEKTVFYELSVFKRISPFPAQKVFIKNGYAIFYISETLENATSCVLTDEKGIDHALIANNINSSEGIELYNICGVRMRVNQSRVGLWNLRQSRGNYEYINSSFTINWSNSNPTALTKHLYWQYGDTEKIDISRSRTIYCDIVTPDNVVIPLTEKSCIHKIDQVNFEHAGVWKSRHALLHSMKLFEEDIIVEVWNKKEIEKSVIVEDKNINLLCRSGFPSLDSCTFEMPNGTIISLRAALGDGHYEYYGTGFDISPILPIEKKADCGVTIRNPSQSDYGKWKCSVRKEKNVAYGLFEVVDPQEKIWSKLKLILKYVFK